MIANRPALPVTLCCIAVLLLASCSELPSNLSLEGEPLEELRRPAPSLPPPEEPPEEIAGPPKRSVQPLSVFLDSCQQADCELRFTFSLPMVEVSAEAEPPRVVFHPPQEGEFRWHSPTEMSFVPNAGSLPWGRRVEVTIAEAVPLAGPELALPSAWTTTVQVPFFRAAGKVAPWPVVDREPRFVAFLNSFTGRIGQGPLYLLYDQPVEIDLVAGGLSVVDGDGTPFDIHLAHPEDARQVTGDEELDPSFLVALTLVSPPVEGETVTISLPRQPVTEPDKLFRQELTVATEFRLVRQGPAHRRGDDSFSDRVPLKTVWELELNHPFELSLLQEALRVTPEPLDVRVTGLGTTQARVHLDLEPGTRYRMTIDPAFTDVLGNALRDDFAAVLRSADLPPIAELPSLPTILESQSPRLFLRGRNVESPRLAVHRFGAPRDFAGAVKQQRRGRCAEYGSGSVLVDEIDVDGGPAELNVTQTWAAPLDLAPGLYCVELRALGRGSRASGELVDAALVQSSDLGLTTKVFEDSVFAWVTRLSDATARRAEVTVLSPSGSTLGTAATDEQGVATVAVKGLSATGLDGPLFVVAEAMGDETTGDGTEVAVVRVDDERLSHAWQFGLDGEVEGVRSLPAAVFTERGVYRPGETVHVKIIAPESVVPPPTAPLSTPVRRATLQVHDPRGQQVVSRGIDLDAFGGGAFDLELKEQAPVGAYSVRVTLPGPRVDRIAQRGFRVEEYRVPSFQVTVESPQPWKRGAEVSALVSASYLHGGTLDGRQVRWKVVREPQAFTAEAFPGYVFSLDGENRAAGGMLTRGEERLDGQGRRVVVFRPDHASTVGAMRYVVEATVTDVDRQAYAGRVSRLVHPAAFYVGLLPPPRRVLAQDDKLAVPVAALRPDGTPLDGVEVRLQLERIDHHTSARLGGSEVRHLNRPVPVDVEQCLVTTGPTATECGFDLGRHGAGRYRVRAWARDLEHQVVQAGFDFTVSGENPAAWPRFDQDRVELVADRPSYKPGDVARLVVETPFEHARGLLTVERDRVLEHRLFDVDGDTPALELEITEEHAPNVYVSVMLLRGREHDLTDATGFETGAPSFKLGYTELEVEPTSRRLDVAVDAPRLAQPGRTLPVKLTVRDRQGRPRAAQATLMVVDEAVLGMTGFRTPDPVAEIYAERPLGVRTGESRLELAHAKRSRRERLFPGGDGGEGPLLGDFPENLRSLFKSTAYWNPAVPVGPDGLASVDVELPDNTTTYRVMAVVSDAHGRAGSAESQVVVKKPLMVRAVVPRFVYPGDEVRVEAQVWNGTRTDGTAELEVELEGWSALDVEPKTSSKVPSGGSTSFPFLVSVTGRETARVIFAVRMGEYSDAVEVELPILSPGTRRSQVVSKTVAGDDSVTVTLPSERLPGTAQVEVVASTTALSELKDAVGYLMQYPNGCIEQTTSTAYPLVVLGDLLPEIGVTVDPEELRKFSEAGIRRILSFQTSQGGLSYWPGSQEPHAFATAFGLTALIEGRKRGYDVPDEALAGMADYLEAALRRGDVTESIPHGGMADGDTRALFVMTLGRLGRPQPGYLATLWRRRDKVTAFGLSFLAIAASEAGEHALVAPILAEIRRVSKEEEREAWFEGRPKGGWSFDSPLRTHASALLAFATAGDSGDMGGKLLTGLLERRRGGMWGNTQENVFGIMGVHAVSGARAEGPGPSMELVVDGRPISEESMEKPSRRVRRLTLSEDDLGLEEGQSRDLEAALRHRGGPPIILTVRTRYEVPLTGANLLPRSNGFEIRREYETLDGGPFGPVIPLGSLVRVRLRVKSSRNLNYVAIADKLPAGLEPLNTHLETTEKIEAGESTPTAERSLELLSYQEVRDSRVAFFVDDMPAGEYEYSYVARATTPGTFLRPAADVEAMYLPEVSGATAIDEVTVR